MKQNWIKRLKLHRHLWLLGIWIIIGTVVRFTQLTGKSPWTDEFATMVFSLGNTYHSVSLNEVISVDALLQPLKLNLDAKVSDVVSLLLQEDNHPPLYFVLAHLWMKLFPTSGEYISLWVARSLPAFLGVLSIPSMYLLGRFAFRSASVGQLSAAMMAVSPYAVFLAQEARHYTLAILLVIASLGCLIVASRFLWYQILLPPWLILGWILINCLGLATHYFFNLTLTSEVITLLILSVYQIKEQGKLKFNHWLRLSLVGLGTLTTILVWFAIIVPRDYGNNMTDWIRQNYQNFLSLISPIFQLFAAWITMLSLLPVESSLLAVIIISGFIMLVFFIWVTPKLFRSLKVAWNQQPLEVGIVLGFLASAIFIIFSITYIFGMDITRGARYSFTYFPAVILLIGVGLSVLWNQYKNGEMTVTVVLLMGLLSSIVVCFNLGYQKYYQPDRLLQIIEQNSTNDILIATTYRSLVQTGEMMGIAWEIKHQAFPLKTHFLLVSEKVESTLSLQKSVNKLAKPLDLWTVNFHASINLNKCSLDSQKFLNISGYSYQKYRCL